MSSNEIKDYLNNRILCNQQIYKIEDETPGVEEARVASAKRLALRNIYKKLGEEGLPVRDRQADPRYKLVTDISEITPIYKNQAICNEIKKNIEGIEQWREWVKINWVDDNETYNEDWKPYDGPRHQLEMGNNIFPSYTAIESLLGNVTLEQMSKEAAQGLLTLKEQETKYARFYDEWAKKEGAIRLEAERQAAEEKMRLETEAARKRVEEAIKEAEERERAAKLKRSVKDFLLVVDKLSTRLKKKVDRENDFITTTLPRIFSLIREVSPAILRKPPKQVALSNAVKDFLSVVDKVSTKLGSQSKTTSPSMMSRASFMGSSSVTSAFTTAQTAARGVFTSAQSAATSTLKSPLIQNISNINRGDTLTSKIRDFLLVVDKVAGRLNEKSGNIQATVKDFLTVVDKVAHKLNNSNKSITQVEEDKYIDTYNVFDNDLRGIPLEESGCEKLKMRNEKGEDIVLYPFSKNEKGECYYYDSDSNSLRDKASQ